MRRSILILGLAILANAGLTGQIIIMEPFSGSGETLPAPWVVEAGNPLLDDGSWGGKGGAFYPLTLSPNTQYTITYDVLIPLTGTTEFGGMALVTESPVSPVDSVDSSSIAKAGWLMFRENGKVESRSFSTGTIGYDNFYVPGGTGGSENSLIEVILTTGPSAAASTVSLSVDGVAFDMDNDELTPNYLSGVDLSGLTYVGLTGYADHIADTFSISATAVPEPAALGLAAGMVAMGLVWWRRRRN